MNCQQARQDTVMNEMVTEVLFYHVWYYLGHTDSYDFCNEGE